MDIECDADNNKSAVFYVCLAAAKSVDELLSLAAYCRDRTNPYMFIYALSVVVIHKPETRGLELPSHAEMFPSLYMDSSVFNRAREESEVVQAGSRVSRIIIIIINFFHLSENEWDFL